MSEPQPPNILETRRPPEQLFNWADNWREMKVEKRGEGGVWLTLYYDPELTGDDLEGLKVQKGMPFEMMLKVEDVDLSTILPQFKDSIDFSRAERNVFFIGNREEGLAEGVTQRLKKGCDIEIKEILKKADFSFFWHGWASDPRVWDEMFLKDNIERRSIKEKPLITKAEPVVNILPFGMGIKGGCQTRKIEIPTPNGESRTIEVFTPEDYGEQIVYFTDRFFGWENQIDYFGHSMGGIGIAWAALKIAENEKYRTPWDKKPDPRLWMIAPAYPAEANIFIKNYLKLGIKALRLLPKQMRFLGGPVTYAINLGLLPDAPPELHLAHTAVALSNPEVIEQTMYGLEYQDEFTAEQWRDILNIYASIVMETNTGDRVVSEDESLKAFQRLTKQAVVLGGVEKPAPLTLTEKWLTIPAGHYTAAQLRDRFIDLRMTMGDAVVESPLRALPVLFDIVSKIRKAKLPELIRFLQEELELIKGESKEEREKNRESRKIKLFELMSIDIFGDSKLELRESERLEGFLRRRGKAGEISEEVLRIWINNSQWLENTILRYYRMLWPNPGQPPLAG